MTKAKAKVFYTYIGIILLCCISFIAYQHIKIKSSISDFFKTYNIQKNDFQYHNVSQSFFGKSLIFYKVKIPILNVDMSVEKVIIRKEKDDLNIKFIGANLNVINSLRRLYNIRILDELNTYNPTTDSFQKPLQTLALCNIDSVKFDLSFVLSPQKKQTLLTGKATLNQLAEIDFSLLATSKKPSKGLLYTLYGKLKPLNVTIKDFGLFPKYDTYLESIDLHKDMQIRQLLQKESIRYNGKPNMELNLIPAYKMKK